MASLKVTSDLAYQAAVLGWMNPADLFKLLAQMVTSEKSPKSAGVDLAIARSDHCRCVSTPQSQWITAWEFRGTNSTIRRRSAVEVLFAQHLPYFRLNNAISITFINDVDALAKEAIDAAKDKLRATGNGDKEDGAQAA
jgi:hypothetical protein